MCFALSRVRILKNNLLIYLTLSLPLSPSLSLPLSLSLNHKDPKHPNITISSITFRTMATADIEQERVVFQTFCDKSNNQLLPNVQAHRIGGEYFVYWEDIKTAFSDIDHLQKFLSHDDDTVKRGLRVLFEVEQYVKL